MTDSIKHGSELLDQANPTTINRIANIKRGVRERAIVLLMSPLGEMASIDDAIVQSIPMELLARSDIIGAVWFTETMGNLGDSITYDVLRAVIEGALSDIGECALHGDNASAQVISASLDALFRMAKIHPLYKDMGDLYFLSGEHEYCKNKPDKALPQYEKAIAHGSIDGYFSAANIYTELGQYDKSKSVLEAGLATWGEPKFLGELISVLCKSGNIGEALKRYDEFKGISEKNIPPFLLYKGSIENDNNVRELEEILAQYNGAGFTFHSPAFQVLVVSCSIYIEDSINKENVLLQNLYARGTNDTDGKIENDQEYIRIIQRRLWLMQIDLISLGNQRYLEYYLSDMKKFGVDGNPRAKEILQDFFMDYTSKEIEDERFRFMARSNVIENETTTMEVPEESRVPTDTNIYPSSTLLQDISLHVSQIGELYFSGIFHDIQEKTIIPLLRECSMIEGDYNEEMENGFITTLASLKTQHDYYYALRPNIRESYEKFIRQFDETYGIFYRKRIQYLAISSDMTPDKYPQILKENHEISFLFWIEKMVSGCMLTNNPTDLEAIVHTYSLDEAGSENTLLLGSFLLDISPEYAIMYLAGYPQMLNIPEAIYIITEGLRCLNIREQKKMINALHKVTQTAYVARGFFEHIRSLFWSIYQEDPTEMDIQYMLLASGSIAILQRKEKVQSIMNFRTASEFGSLDGLIQTGESFEELGEYSRAIEFFEQAFCQAETITVVTKLISCAIRAKAFDKAQIYIDHALKHGYNISNYILAFHLWQSQTRFAFLQVISMIHSGTQIIDSPEGVVNLLLIRIRSLANGDVGDKIELKILASYILIHITYSSPIPDPEASLIHWNNIFRLCSDYKGEELHEKIQECLTPLVGETDIDFQKSSPSEISVALIQVHAIGIHNTLRAILEESRGRKDIEKTKEIFAVINNFCAGVFILLQKFPNTEEYILSWRRALNFYPTDHPIANMPNTLQ